MSARPLVRLGGFVLILGGVLWGVSEIGWGLFVFPSTHPIDYPQPTATILSFVGLAAFILILMGLPGLHSVQARRSRTLGLIAFVILFIGEAQMVAGSHFRAFGQAALADLVTEAEAAGITFEEPALAAVGWLATYAFHILGWILFGVAALRAKVLPRWPVVMSMVVPLLMFVGSAALAAMGDAPSVLFAPILMVWVVGLAWLGVALIRFAREDTRTAGETGAPHDEELARS